jgi:YgiT-type zinc finger domain-containing protein
MICLICRQAEIVDGRTSVKFERGETHLVIARVPARICPQCGEAYVNEEVAAQLLRGAGEMAEAGVFNGVCEYDGLSE